MQEPFLKLLLVGDSGVGKSCILTSFTENKFVEAFYNTIGVDFKTQAMCLDGRHCKVQIWDTAGQERFRTITNNYYKGSNGVVVVFDLSFKKSLQSVQEYWLEEIDKRAVNRPVIVMVGNKCDLTKREVTEQEAMSVAKKYNIDYIECSAANATNIRLVFETIARKVLKSIQGESSGKEEQKDRLMAQGIVRNKKKSCC